MQAITTKKSRSKSYKNYKKTYVFQQQYTNRAPLSVVCQENGQWGAITNDEMLLTCIEFGAYKG